MFALLTLFRLPLLYILFLWEESLHTQLPLLGLHQINDKHFRLLNRYPNRHTLALQQKLPHEPSVSHIVLLLLIHQIFLSSNPLL